MQSRSFWGGIALLHVFGLVGAFALLPDRLEKSAMMMRDTDYTGALQSMETLFNSGDRQRPMMMKLAQLNAEQGNTERMGEILKTYVKTYPDDLDGQLKLVAFYRDNYEQDKYLIAMNRLMQMQPSRETFVRLVQGYRIRGSYQDELDLIEKWKSSPFVEGDDLQRLGRLLLAAGKADDAIRILQYLDDRISEFMRKGDKHELTVGLEALFDALLASNKIEEAYGRLLVWHRTLSEPEMLERLTGKFAATGREGVIAFSTEKPSSSTDEITLEFIARLITQNNLEQARSALIAWRAADRNPMGHELGQYILLSLTAGDLPAAFEAAVRTGIHSVPRPALMKLIERLIEERQISLIRTLRKDLNDNLLRDVPLLAAKLAFLEGQIEQSRNHLFLVNLLQLKPEQYDDWYQMVVMLNAEQQAYSHLSSIWSAKQLPQSLLSIYADLSRKLGRQDRLFEIATKLGGKFPVKDLNY